MSGKMQISSALRLRPYSHLPGTSLLLPGSSYQIQIFPCLIKIFDLQLSSIELIDEYHLKIIGPVEQFTICNDLEKGTIRVWGKSLEGWMMYRIQASQDQKGVRLYVERGPKSRLYFENVLRKESVSDGEYIDLLKSEQKFTPFQSPLCERLSLGINKAQDWELIKRRGILQEIFPFWHQLGQLVPKTFSLETQTPSGTLALLANCKKSISTKRPEEFEKDWKNLILAGFHDLLIPQLDDLNFQGIAEPFIGKDTSPLVLLTEGSRLIRQLFLKEEGNQIAILPSLLPSFSSGRLLNVTLQNGIIVDMEWTKKTIRRVNLFVREAQQFAFKFRSNVRSYRLRMNSKDKGKRIECSTPLFLEKETYYFFDNFE